MTAFKHIPGLLLTVLLSATMVHAKPADHPPVRDFHKPFSTTATSSRPSRSEQYLTPGGHFIIHYDNSGYNAVPQDYTYNDSLPDFVFKAAEYLDDSYRTLHDSLGFDTPPVDNIESPEIDIYFTFDLMYYGVTQPENIVDDGSWTSYLTLSTQLHDSTIFYTYGLEGLRVTCAHELFHIFQLGYKFRDQDIFYFEMSSVWFEEYMYPEVNDYHSYVNEYAGDWNYAINSGALDYDNAGFNLYIDKRFSTDGNNIIHSIWDRILFVNALSAIRNELTARGITFEEALKDWGTAQVLCGPYAAENFLYPFNDAAELETIGFTRNSDHILNSLTQDIDQTKTPAVTYYKITGLPSSIMLFEAMFDEGAKASLVCLNAENSEVKQIGHSQIVIDGSAFNDYILVIGNDADNVSGSYAFTEVQADQAAGIYPNPLDPGESLTLSYVLTDAQARGEFRVYDLAGRTVFSRALTAGERTAGLRSIPYYPMSIPSGIYIAALKFEDAVITEKFTYIK